MRRVEVNGIDFCQRLDHETHLLPPELEVERVGTGGGAGVVVGGCFDCVQVTAHEGLLA